MQEKIAHTSYLVPFIISGISFISGIIVSYFSAKISKSHRDKEKIESNIEKQLKEFYGPLRAMLEENSRIYNDFGPKTFQTYSAETAMVKGEIWESLKESVIIPNLKIIRDLIQKNWIISNVSEKKHLKDLVLHCVAFCEYDKSPNEMYTRYKYNNDWLTQIDADIKNLEGKK